MRVFVDTSAFLAVLNADNLNHSAAKLAWNTLLLSETPLVTTNYVLVETFALLQRRFGVSATRSFQESITPLLQIDWIDEATHKAGLQAMLTANRRSLSLVDCISFEAMRRLGIATAFAFDAHFAEQGFALA